MRAVFFAEILEPDSNRPHPATQGDHDDVMTDRPEASHPGGGFDDKIQQLACLIDAGHGPGDLFRRREPGQGAADQDGDPGGAGGEGADGAVGDGPPADPAGEVGADQVDPLPRDPQRLARGAGAEDVARAVGAAALAAEVAGAVEGQGAAVGGDDDRERADAVELPGLPGTGDSQTTRPRRSWPRSTWARRARVSQATGRGGRVGGLDQEPRGSARSPADGRRPARPAGSKIRSRPSSVVAAAKSVGADGQVLDRRRRARPSRPTGRRGSPGRSGRAPGRWPGRTCRGGSPGG